ncbi:hypothetical protein OE88DRAFT_1640188 [Heliocybe sulcata]|uniref:DUF4218 domain-containing protein n=1 Tax=Heliocybe sulcata TaxID=5364 RepID=A0A5C3MLR1_9AGAM|nr:hypothetical protein OE88DRAFT_1640188 [Heliocybe sulcata]
MACLNLPYDIRYKPENMYLAGIIPGPREPHLTDLNHYVRPLVDDMSMSWSKGVFYSKTALHPLGRLTRSAIAAVVCDLPAARQAAALAGHNSHHYCSVCQRVHRATVGETDFEGWSLRDVDALHRHAEEWRDAPTSKEQEKLFKMHGIWWSELWCLPYWDPTRQLVVDSMHCILEGLIAYHCREVLQLTKAEAARLDPAPAAYAYEFRVYDPTNNPHPLSETEAKQVTQIHALLTASQPDLSNRTIKSLATKLEGKNRPALAFVCRDLGCLPDNHGDSPCDVQWRQSQQMGAEDTTSRKLVTQEVIQHIHNVIRETATPSWIDSVPYNFGEAAAGMLKADEWRTMTTIYLPIALVTLWGAGTQHATPQLATRCREVLDHTMGLFSAAWLICLRMTNLSCASRCRQYLADYIRNLRRLHRHAQFRTNHHMALHIYDFLLLFGPVHSWWCFPFERLVGWLQRQGHNHKFGELELSMIKSFIRGARLRHWLAREDCPPAIKECNAVFQEIYGQSGRPDFAEDRRICARATPDELKALVSTDRVILTSRTKHDGVGYATRMTHIGNSLIEFYPSGDAKARPVPGCIEYIYKPEGAQALLFAVRRHMPVEGAIDPFSQYPDFPAQLYSSRLSNKLELVEAHWVFSHFAQYQTNPDQVVIVSLSRVCAVFVLFIRSLNCICDRTG